MSSKLGFSVGDISVLWREECPSCNPVQNSPKTKNFSKLSNELCWQFSMIPLKMGLRWYMEEKQEFEDREKDWFEASWDKFKNSLLQFIQWQGITLCTMLILSLLPRIILHLAPSAIRADRVDCSTLCWCSEIQRCHEYLQQPGDIAKWGAVQALYCVLRITLPPTGRNFIISRCISSLAYLLSSGIRDSRGLVSPHQPIRGQYCPRWPMRGQHLVTGLTPGVWLPGCRHWAAELGWCRHCRGPGSTAWPRLHRKHGVCFGVLGSVEDEDQRIESPLITPGLNTSAQ